MINNYKRIYFLGIGGIGMSSLAFYFINENKYVAGYDKVNSTITKFFDKKVPQYVCFGLNIIYHNFWRRGQDSNLRYV